MKRYCLALDLVDDHDLIIEYETWHKNVWPEVKKSITDSGIVKMEIYRAGNRLVMLIEAIESFSFKRKAAMDQMNDRVMEWENLMWHFQKPLPWAAPGMKWVRMKRIFMLDA